jgi:UDP-glucose 4-epimerase
LRILVTGAAGFIGHHLVRALLANGDSVVGLDDLSTGLRSRLDDVADRMELVVGDIRDRDALDRATVGCDVIFHQAALASVERSMRDPRLVTDVNVNGTIEVMLAAARHGVRRLVFAGSSSVYGDVPSLPRREDQRPEPRSPYAAGKLAGEHIIHSMGAATGVETVALRYFNIFGPGQDPAVEYAAVVPRFVTAALNGRAPVVYGDGEQTRDFTYIDNAVAANFLAATVPGVAGLTCNIGCGEQYSLNDLLEAIGTETGVALRPVHKPSRPGDVRSSVADIGLARERLGYRVLVDFGEGIRRTVAAYSWPIASAL